MVRLSILCLNCRSTSTLPIIRYKSGLQSVLERRSLCYCPEVHSERDDCIGAICIKEIEYLPGIICLVFKYLILLYGDKERQYLSIIHVCRCDCNFLCIHMICANRGMQLYPALSFLPYFESQSPLIVVLKLV